MTAWNAAAHGWADHWAPLGAPAREAVLRAVDSDGSLLDVGCGSGELCALAAKRGARVSGVDVAAELVEIARQRVPEADLRVGPAERLPWPDDSFDAVTAINVLQFTADFLTALTEAARVTRKGGRIAVCNWGRPRDQEAHVMFERLSEARSTAPSVGEPGVLEDFARRAGLTPERVDEVEVPYEFPDRDTLERAMLALSPAYEIDQDTATRVIRETIEGPVERFRRPDGSYRFDNRWRFMIAVA
jgi:ubiquinone/menaquinone biosynthesis C-methylase UbiE